MKMIDVRKCEQSGNCRGCQKRIRKGDTLIVDETGQIFCAVCVHTGLGLVGKRAEMTSGATGGATSAPAWSGLPPRNAGVFWVRPSPRSSRRTLARWEPKTEALSLAGPKTLADAREKYPEIEFLDSRVKLPK
jgi:hypothetical protein